MKTALLSDDDIIVKLVMLWFGNTVEKMLSYIGGTLEEEILKAVSSSSGYLFRI